MTALYVSICMELVIFHHQWKIIRLCLAYGAKVAMDISNAMTAKPTTVAAKPMPISQRISEKRLSISARNACISARQRFSKSRWLILSCGSHSVFGVGSCVSTATVPFSSFTNMF